MTMSFDRGAAVFSIAAASAAAGPSGAKLTAAQRSKAGQPSALDSTTAEFRVAAARSQTASRRDRRIRYRFGQHGNAQAQRRRAAGPTDSSAAEISSCISSVSAEGILPLPVPRCMPASPRLHSQQLRRAQCWSCHGRATSVSTTSVAFPRAPRLRPGLYLLADSFRPLAAGVVLAMEARTPKRFQKLGVKLLLFGFSALVKLLSNSDVPRCCLFTDHLHQTRRTTSAGGAVRCRFIRRSRRTASVSG